MEQQEIEERKVTNGPLVIGAGHSSPVEIQLGRGPVKVERSFTTNGRVGVTPAGNDDIAQLLRRVDIRFEIIKDAELCEPRLGDRFSTVFLNCSSDAIKYAARCGRSLAGFVAGGGTLYASDWAGAYIQAAFPSILSGEHSGGTGTVRASVLQGDVRRMLGSAHLTLRFDMPSWYRVSRFSPEASAGEVYLAEGRRPLMLAFRHGRGQVVFTSFHNRAQPGEMIDKLLRFLILVPVVRSPAMAVHVVQLTDGNLRRYLELQSGRS
jgi:hypothetical protein